MRDAFGVERGTVSKSRTAETIAGTSGVAVGSGLVGHSVTNFQEANKWAKAAKDDQARGYKYLSSGAESLKGKALVKGRNKALAGGAVAAGGGYLVYRSLANGKKQ